MSRECSYMESVFIFTVIHFDPYETALQKYFVQKLKYYRLVSY